MRTAIDKLLGEGVCAKVFGRMNVYAYADGLPVWANFMLALLDECDTAFAHEQEGDESAPGKSIWTNTRRNERPVGKSAASSGRDRRD